MYWVASIFISQSQCIQVSASHSQSLLIMPMSVGMFSGQTPWHSPLAWLPPHLPLCLPLLEPDTFKIVPQSSPSLESDTLKIIPWSSPQSSSAAGAHDELSLRTIPEIMFEKCHWPSFFIQLQLFICHWPVLCICNRHCTCVFVFYLICSFQPFFPNFYCLLTTSFCHFLSFSHGWTCDLPQNRNPPEPRYTGCSMGEW